MRKLLSDSLVCWWLLLGYVLVAPFLPLTDTPIAWNAIPLMDWQRLLEAAVLLSCLTWAVVFAPPLQSIRSFDHYAWAVVFFLGLVSTFTIASHVEFALLEWSWLLALVTLAAMMRQWSVLDRDSLDKLILLMVLISCLAYLWWFWRLNAFIYFEQAENGIIRSITFPGFSNVRFFSDYQSFMLLLLPTALFRLTEKGFARTLGTWLVGLFFALALIAGSRSLITTHLVLHTVLWMFLGNRYKPFVLMQLRFWVYGVLFFVFLTWILPLAMFGSGGDSLVASSLARTDSSRRTELWVLAWQFIQAHPLLGIGPMHYAAWPNPIAAHPHNLIMQFASEWGIPATLLLVWLVWNQLIARFNLLATIGTEGTGNTALAMTCAGTALLIQSMVAGVLNYPVSQVMALLFFAYPLSIGRQDSSKETSGLHLIGLLAIIITVGTLTTLHSIRERNQCFIQQHWPSNHFSPRFWQQGWIVGACGKEDTLLHLPESILEHIPGRTEP